MRRGPERPSRTAIFATAWVRNFNTANVTVDPVLFWEASDQSLTPYYPFYKVTHKTPIGPTISWCASTESR